MITMIVNNLVSLHPSKKRTMFNRLVCLSATALIFANQSSAQLTNTTAANETLQLNTITTAVPFLLIAPDSRSGGLGDAGVAISADANAVHWNPAKMSFAEDEFEVSLSYSPWLRALVDDMNLAYLSGYKKLNDKQSFGAALRFFSLGNITFTDDQGTAIRDFKPNEYSLDFAFSQKLSKKMSGGVAARYIHSNLTGGTSVGGANSKPGRSVAVDLSFYYENDKANIGKKDAILAIGANISNVGAKMSYTETANQDFIPTNLRLGTALSILMDEYNKLTLTLDANKLLVPTPPVYLRDEDGQPVRDPDTGDFVVAAGRNPDVGVASAIFGSFTDAPGNVTILEDGTVTVEKGSVLKEELREINLGGGFEYVYDNQFAFRSGYFYEHRTKGNRQFITLGAGIKYNVFAIDLSYLISTTQQNPLANTLRFTLRLSFSSLNESAEGEE
jgi:hypothetical protein